MKERIEIIGIVAGIVLSIVALYTSCSADIQANALNEQMLQLQNRLSWNITVEDKPPFGSTRPVHSRVVLGMMIPDTTDPRRYTIKESSTNLDTLRHCSSQVVKVESANNIASIDYTILTVKGLRHSEELKRGLFEGGDGHFYGENAYVMSSDKVNNEVDIGGLQFGITDIGATDSWPLLFDIPDATSGPKRFIQQTLAGIVQVRYRLGDEQKTDNMRVSILHTSYGGRYASSFGPDTSLFYFCTRVDMVTWRAKLESDITFSKEEIRERLERLY